MPSVSVHQLPPVPSTVVKTARCPRVNVRTMAGQRNLCPSSDLRPSIQRLSSPDPAHLLAFTLRTLWPAFHHSQPLISARSTVQICPFIVDRVHPPRHPSTCTPRTIGQVIAPGLSTSAPHVRPYILRLRHHILSFVVIFNVFRVFSPCESLILHQSSVHHLVAVPSQIFVRTSILSIHIVPPPLPSSTVVFFLTVGYLAGVPEIEDRHGFTRQDA